MVGADICLCASDGIRKHQHSYYFILIVRAHIPVQRAFDPPPSYAYAAILELQAV